MEWMPELRIGWPNGWIAVALLGVVDIVFFLALPRRTVSRLFDRSGWTRKQVPFATVGKLLALACLVLVTLTPLKIGSPVLALGAVAAIVGLVGMAKALLDFAHTPVGEPVRRGIYRLSRHPQTLMSLLVLLGGCIGIGSWVAVVLLLAARALSHFSLLAEEAVCLRLYGEPYAAYMRAVPRYFLFA